MVLGFSGVAVAHAMLAVAARPHRQARAHYLKQYVFVARRMVTPPAVFGAVV